jgi:tRNA threonylcarbamoyladenosine biosynthesis protein TsaB
MGPYIYRVASAAMARGLGVALNIPIIGINSLAAIAGNEMTKNLPIVVAVDARAGEIYFASFDQAGLEVTAPAIVPLAEIQHLMPTHSAAILGTGAELLLQKLGNDRYVRSDADDLPIAKNFVRLAATMPAPALPPEPLYLRAPDVKPQAAKISFSTAGPAAAKLLAEIHGESFDTQWNEKPSRTSELSRHKRHSHFQPEQSNRFLFFRKAADEAEILTICTRPAVRQRDTPNP